MVKTAAAVKSAAPVKRPPPVQAKPNPGAAAVSNLESLPIILTLDEVAGLYRLSARTVRNAIQAGTFRPRYWDKYPYRWRRDDVVADLNRQRDDKRRAHGFASTRSRQARAKLKQDNQTRPAR